MLMYTEYSHYINILKSVSFFCVWVDGLQIRKAIFYWVNSVALEVFQCYLVPFKSVI